MLRAADDCHKHRQDEQLLVILGLFLPGMKKIPEKTLSAMEHLPDSHHLAHFNIPMHLKATQFLFCVRHLEVIYGRAPALWVNNFTSITSLSHRILYVCFVQLLPGQDVTV